VEPLKYHSHVKTTTRSYCLGCNFFLRQDLQLIEKKERQKSDFSFPASFIFKDGSLEEISINSQEVQETQELKKPRIRGVETY